jgi:hypothetical protein
MGTSRPRLEDNIKIDLKDIIWECMDWINLAEDRQVGLLNIWQ